MRQPQTLTCGSIPACAGEPSPQRISRISLTVYPRVCGGTPLRRKGQPKPRGLSPRVRGNPYREGIYTVENGSIPACAGEPGARAGGRRRLPVYPRVCGGTLIMQLKELGIGGLSPRVRGNR